MLEVHLFIKKNNPILTIFNNVISETQRAHSTVVVLGAILFNNGILTVHNLIEVDL